MHKYCYNCLGKNIKYLYYTRDYLTEELFKVYKCSDCDLIFPFEYPSNLNKYYPEKYRSYLPFVKKILQIKSKLYINKINNKYFQNIDSNQKNILEIGCGNGQMLEIFKKLSWNVCGIERSDAVLESNNLNISNKNLDEYSDNIFDLVFLYNSFEHLHEPKKTLIKISEKVKKNGLILITVPSHDSLQYKFGKNDWLHLDMPRHLNIFSHASFLKMIKDTHNLKIVSIRSIGFDLEFYGWFQTIINRLSKRNNLLLKYLMNISSNKIIFFLSLIQFLILFLPSLILTLFTIFFNKGSIVEIIIKKIN